MAFQSLPPEGKLCLYTRKYQNYSKAPTHHYHCTTTTTTTTTSAVYLQSMLSVMNLMHGAQKGMSRK